jgi:hypothetical protein
MRRALAKSLEVAAWASYCSVERHLYRIRSIPWREILYRAESVRFLGREHRPKLCTGLETFSFLDEGRKSARLPLFARTTNARQSPSSNTAAR